MNQTVYEELEARKKAIEAAAAEHQVLFAAKLEREKAFQRMTQDELKQRLSELIAWENVIINDAQFQERSSQSRTIENKLLAKNHSEKYRITNKLFYTYGYSHPKDDAVSSSETIKVNRFQDALLVYKEEQAFISYLYNSVTDLPSLAFAENAKNDSLNMLRLAFYESTKEFNRLEDCMKIDARSLLKVSNLIP